MIELKDFYSQYKNFYRQRVDAASVAGARCHPDWCLLARIEDDDSAPVLLPNGKRSAITVTDEIKARKKDPMVFQVLAKGDNCTHFDVDDFVSITYLAGDTFANSSVVQCHRDDVPFCWGPGLKL